MTISFSVFLAHERLPTAAAWQGAAKESGFALEFSEGMEPATHSGYVPCPDDRVGFELYREPYTPEQAEIGPAAAEAIGGRDTSLTFRFSGRAADRDAAVAAAATLASISDGILLDSEAGHFIDPASALAWARGDHYRPIAVQRPRGGRKRGRIRASLVVRILMLLLVTVVFAMLFG